mmetsp:Transcript_87366/g.232073  ORF Transcript_87366/g.232073 Transcript_87366/m.232073 type:complete len:317 (-) Transcript_87366:93-1043(-)
MELASPPLAELFDKYEDQIEVLRDSLPVGRRRLTDNLFLLRYLLSYGAPSSAAAEAVVKALEWRESHSTLVEAARECENELDSSPLREHISAEHLRTLDSCLKAAFAGTTECPPGFPLYQIQSGQSAIRELMGLVPGDAVSLWLTWRNEIGYWRCDTQSRRSCHLVKQIVVMNLAGCRLMDQDPRFFVAYGRSSKRSEFLHPQLLARQVVVNPPAFMGYFWALGKRLLSERLLKKVHIHNGKPGEHLAKYFQGSPPVELVESVGKKPADCSHRDSVASDGPHKADKEKHHQAAIRWAESATCVDMPLPAEVVEEEN